MKQNNKNNQFPIPAPGFTTNCCVKSIPAGAPLWDDPMSATVHKSQTNESTVAGYIFPSTASTTKEVLTGDVAPPYTSNLHSTNPMYIFSGNPNSVLNS